VAGQPSEETGARAQACINWSYQRTALLGMGPEHCSGLINGIRMGVALAHEDPAWASAACEELSAHVEHLQEALEDGDPARRQEQSLAVWREARSVIDSTREPKADSEH
jgi:hypothetical protein